MYHQIPFISQAKPNLWFLFVGCEPRGEPPLHHRRSVLVSISCHLYREVLRTLAPKGETLWHWAVRQALLQAQD
ncbi:hypothetical protein V6N11_001228 [Hibiscus sabdariffa]|uniref:Uncharacterized protein n=1 Tax=Hibiscus sabdariffa TaxID=183260 RepID=A0ABR2RZ48_9ROSI